MMIMIEMMMMVVVVMILIPKVSKLLLIKVKAIVKIIG